MHLSLISGLGLVSLSWACCDAMHCLPSFSLYPAPWLWEQGHGLLLHGELCMWVLSCGHGAEVRAGGILPLREWGAFGWGVQP